MTGTSHFQNEDIGQTEDAQPGPTPTAEPNLIDDHEKIVLEVISECKPDGFLRRFWDELERIEYKEQPVFRLAAGIVTLAGLIGRKVVTPDGVNRYFDSVGVMPGGE